MTGKHVGKLQAFVMRGISLSGFDWVGYGYRLLGADTIKFERDFFCLRFGEDAETPCREFIDCEEISLNIRRLLRALPQPIKKAGKWTYTRDSVLLPEAVVPVLYRTLWAGTRCRVCLQRHRSLRSSGTTSADGRQAKHGSQDYVLTSRQVVHNVQSTTCRAILEGIPKPGIVEEECLNEVQEYFVKRGGPPLQLKRQLRCLEWDDEKGTWLLGGSFPLINMSPGVLEQAKGSSSAVLPEKCCGMHRRSTVFRDGVENRVSAASYKPLLCSASGAMPGDCPDL